MSGVGWGHRVFGWEDLPCVPVWCSVFPVVLFPVQVWHRVCGFSWFDCVHCVHCYPRCKGRESLALNSLCLVPKRCHCWWRFHPSKGLVMDLRGQRSEVNQDRRNSDTIKTCQQVTCFDEETTSRVRSNMFPWGSRGVRSGHCKENSGVANCPYSWVPP